MLTHDHSFSSIAHIYSSYISSISISIHASFVTCIMKIIFSSMISNISILYYVNHSILKFNQ